MSESKSMQVKAALEALLFVSANPLSSSLTAEILGITEDELSELLAELAEDYGNDSRGIMLEKVAGGSRIVTKPVYDEIIREAFQHNETKKLSHAALETLAIIAYRQPITTPEVEEIRGVDSGGVIRSLLDKKLIKISGRKKVVGKPLIYRTTKDFLMHFGLNDLVDLPSMEEFDELMGYRKDERTLFDDNVDDNSNSGEKNEGKTE